jgi:rhodanese-related sulfurtransferase
MFKPSGISKNGASGQTFLNNECHCLKTGTACILKSSDSLKGYTVSFIVENWMLFALAIASGAMLLWPGVNAGAGQNAVGANAVVQLMNKEKAIVVDVCSADEYAKGHIVGAKNIPLDKLQDDLATQVKNKQLPVVLVCASGARSNRAVATAKKLGFERTYSLTGGMGAWREANLPVEKV